LRSIIVQADGHGRYTAKAVNDCREIAVLLRVMRENIGQLPGSHFADSGDFQMNR